MAYGADANRSYSTMLMPGYGTLQKEAGLLPESTLTPEHLGLVPADASWAMVSSMNVQGTFDMVMGMLEQVGAEQGMGDPVEMISQMTGINVEADLIAHLGERFGLYASDTTGGGGFTSAVLFMEIKSREGLMLLVERLNGIVNGLSLIHISEPTRPY